MVLMMGINCEGILVNLLLGGDVCFGFEVISGLFLIGYNDSDFINYGYNFCLEFMNYDWWLVLMMILFFENVFMKMFE